MPNISFCTYHIIYTIEKSAAQWHAIHLFIQFIKIKKLPSVLPLGTLPRRPLIYYTVIQRCKGAQAARGLALKLAHTFFIPDSREQAARDPLSALSKPPVCIHLEYLWCTRTQTETTAGRRVAQARTRVMEIKQKSATAVFCCCLVYLSIYTFYSLFLFLISSSRVYILERDVIVIFV